jgi:hypothetical protein
VEISFVSDELPTREGKSSKFVFVLSAEEALSSTACDDEKVEQEKEERERMARAESL